MSQPVITCHAGDSLNVAAQKMWEHDCGAVLVVDDSGGLIGIITDRDLCMAAYTTGAALGAIRVTTAMAHQVLTCGPEDSLEAASRLMREAKVRRVPVVDAHNRPVGLLSLGDIACSAGAARKTQDFDHELVQTLAAVCEPRQPDALAKTPQSSAITKPRRSRRPPTTSARA